MLRQHSFLRRSLDEEVNLGTLGQNEVSLVIDLRYRFFLWSIGNPVVKLNQRLAKSCTDLTFKKRF